jgi:Periplasmic binding protein
VFRICNTTRMETDAVGKLLIEKYGKKWDFITPDYAFGRTLQKGFEANLKKYGGTEVGALRLCRFTAVRQVVARKLTGLLATRRPLYYSIRDGTATVRTDLPRRHNDFAKLHLVRHYVRHAQLNSHSPASARRNRLRFANSGGEAGEIEQTSAYFVLAAACRVFGC